MANGGHGEGMSVTKSYEMADSGKNTMRLLNISIQMGLPYLV